MAKAGRRPLKRSRALALARGYLGPRFALLLSSCGAFASTSARRCASACTHGAASAGGQRPHGATARARPAPGHGVACRANVPLPRQAAEERRGPHRPRVAAGVLPRAQCGARHRGQGRGDSERLPRAHARAGAHAGEEVREETRRAPPEHAAVAGVDAVGASAASAATCQLVITAEDEKEGPRRRRCGGARPLCDLAGRGTRGRRLGAARGALRGRAVAPGADEAGRGGRGSGTSARGEARAGACLGPIRGSTHQGDSNGRLGEFERGGDGA